MLAVARARRRAGPDRCSADWVSALIIAVTLPLIPVFVVLVGLATQADATAQWRLLARWPATSSTWSPACRR